MWAKLSNLAHMGEGWSNVVEIGLYTVLRINGAGLLCIDSCRCKNYYSFLFAQVAFLQYIVLNYQK
jgi:hypothetical protein